MPSHHVHAPAGLEEDDDDELHPVRIVLIITNNKSNAMVRLKVPPPFYICSHINTCHPYGTHNISYLYSNV